MRYYIRAKEFIKHLFGRLRSGAEERAQFFRTKVRAWNWTEQRFRFKKGFDYQKILQHKFLQTLRNFDYEKFFDQFFSPRSYRILHRSFLVTVFVILTYTAGKMVGYILFPQKKFLSYKQEAPLGQNFLQKYEEGEWEQILATDLFRTESQKTRLSKPKGNNKNIARASRACNDSNKKSSLPLKLINTVVLQNREKSVASVQDKKKILYLREGDRMDNILVKKISRLKMVFANQKTGECEYIANSNAQEERFWQSRKPEIVSPAKGRKLLAEQKNENVIKVGNTYQIKKELKDNILNNINTILTQARAIEIKNPDGSLCFKMVDIVPGSPYSMLDIQNDDIICNINGKKIENFNSLFALFGKMRDIQNLQMVINRDGQDIPMEYNFE